MTKEERLNAIQNVIDNMEDGATKEMYQTLPKRIIYPIKWPTIKVISYE